MKKKMVFLIIFVVAIFTCKSSLADCRGGQFWLCLPEAVDEINHGNMDKAQELFTIGCRGGEAINCIYRDDYVFKGISPYKMALHYFGLISSSKLSRLEYEILPIIMDNNDSTYRLAKVTGLNCEDSVKLEALYFEVYHMVRVYDLNKGFKGVYDRIFGNRMPDVYDWHQYGRNLRWYDSDIREKCH